MRPVNELNIDIVAFSSLYNRVSRLYLTLYRTTYLLTMKSVQFVYSTTMDRWTVTLVLIFSLFRGIYYF